jgi:hypothetical protein
MENTDNLCAICLENFNLENKVTLNCNHYFCKVCIEEWSKYKSSCPMCRSGENEEEEDEPENETVNLYFIEYYVDSEPSSNATNSRSVSEENSDDESEPIEMNFSLSMLTDELLSYLDNWLRNAN